MPVIFELWDYLTYGTVGRKTKGQKIKEYGIKEVMNYTMPLKQKRHPLKSECLVGLMIIL